MANHGEQHLRPAWQSDPAASQIMPNPWNTIRYVISRARSMDTRHGVARRWLEWRVRERERGKP